MGTERAGGRTVSDDVHVPFLAASLIIGVFGGFTLAVSLPLEAALDGLDVGWVAHAQVHGHLQTVGFAGLFVIGVGLRLSPRFGRGTLAAPGLVRPGWALLVLGVLLRAIAQPLAEHAAFAALLAAASIMELLGAVTFAAIFAGTLRPGLRALQAPALLLFAAMAWLVVQAALGAWWLTALADSRGTILGHARDSTLVNLQFFGVLLNAILGVGMRSFPTFFGMPPVSAVLGRAVAAVLNAGLLVWTGAALLAAERGAGVDRATALGAFAVGIAIVLAVTTFGLGRRSHRLAAASRGFIWALQPAMAWLAVTGLGLAWAGGRAAFHGDGLDVEAMDAVRHIFGVGVVTLAIVAMAQLILPEFASERIVSPAAPWRGAAFGVALSVAAVLRGVVPWSGIAGEQRFWLMGLGGSIALVATALFGALYVRARRRHLAYTARIAAMRARNTPLEVVDRP